MITSRARKPSSATLAYIGPEADDLGPLPRWMVAKTLADGSRGAACEGWVGVGFDLELERRAGRCEVEQLVEQQRALVASCAVEVAQPPCEDLRRGALMRPPETVVPRSSSESWSSTSSRSAVRQQSVSRPSSGCWIAWWSAASEESGPYARPRRWAYSAGSTPTTLTTQARCLVTSLRPSCEQVVENGTGC